MKSFFVQKIKNAPKISKRLVYGIVTDLGSASRQLNVFTLFVGFGVGCLIFLCNTQYST